MLCRVSGRALCTLAVSLCLFSTDSLSAPPDTLTDSRTVLLKGIGLYEEGKYKESIALFRSVPEGDTNYTIALNEWAMASLADSAFEDTRTIARQALAMPGLPNPRSFLLLLGHATDYLGENDAAIRIYDSILKANPYDHQPWFEKGAVYLRQNDYDRALACFRRALLLNPNHFRSHFNTGVCLIKQGRLAEAYIALSFSLLMTSDANVAKRSLVLLATIQQQTDEITKAYKERTSARNDPAFDEADEIISAKLALSKEYKYESVLAGDATANTLHVILEKVKFAGDDTSFVMQYYMPFFTQAFARGDFDPLILLMYSGFGIEPVDKLVKKNSGSIKDMRAALFEYTSKIGATQILSYNARMIAPERFASLPSEELFVVGGLQSRDPLKFRPGPVEIYVKGNFTGKGLANASGAKDGEWIYYYDNGNLRSKETLKNGVLSGPAEYYHSNGTPSYFATYDREGRMTEKREYTYNGVLETVTKDAGDHAVLTSYHNNGLAAYTTKLKDGKIVDVLLKPVHPNGVLAKEIRMENGKRDGIYREYFTNGKLDEETNYRSGDREGPSTTYYPSGKLHYKVSYKNDKLDGPYEEYNEDGKLIERGDYTNGRKSGTVESLTPEGRVYGTVTYRKDKPVAYQYTDNDGKVLSGAERNGDMDMLIAYHPNGNKMSELQMRNGRVHGTAKYYYLTGSLTKQLNYADDKAEGLSTEYYANGRKRSEAKFHQDELQGWYTGYTDNGAKREEGFQQGGQRAGTWTTYYTDGKTEQEEFYVDGELNGPQKNYFSNGRLAYIRYYDKSMLTGLTEYDSTGKEITRVFFPAGNGTYTSHFMNGKTQFSAAMSHGLFEGPSRTYYPNGSLRESGFFHNGRYDSVVTGFHPNGKESMRGHYNDGKRDGKWTFYDSRGIVENEATYIDGDQEGFENASVASLLHTSYEYHNGDLDGRTTLYGDSGRIAAVLIYRGGILSGYTYSGADGKEVPVIPLKNGTGHVQTTYPNGKKAADVMYVEGRHKGDMLRWYSNGQPAQAYHYTDAGDAEGKFERWAPSGQKIYEAMYLRDKLTGVEKTWDIKGTLLSAEGRCGNGAYHGLRQCIDPGTGKMIALHYYYGELVSMD